MAKEKKLNFSITPAQPEGNLVEFHGANLLVSREVYSPLEDSELLAQAVEKYAFGNFLEIGCGSGIQCIVAAKKATVKKVVGVDLNEKAVDLSEKNAVLNGVAGKCLFFKSNLFSTLEKLHDVPAKFDCIAFNPPYLPTGEDEKVKGKLNLALDGGKTGRVLLDKFISAVREHLTPEGIVLLVSSSLSSSKEFENGNKETLAKLVEQGFKAEVVGRQKFFFEELAVFRACA